MDSLPSVFREEGKEKAGACWGSSLLILAYGQEKCGGNETGIISRKKERGGKGGKHRLPEIRPVTYTRLTKEAQKK